jgi:hypothetical protein
MIPGIIPVSSYRYDTRYDSLYALERSTGIFDRIDLSTIGKSYIMTIGEAYFGRRGRYDTGEAIIIPYRCGAF